MKATILRQLLVILSSGAIFISVPLVAANANEMHPMHTESMMHMSGMNMDAIKNMMVDMLNHKIDILNQMMDWTNNHSMMTFDEKSMWDKKIMMQIWEVNDIKKSIEMKNCDMDKMMMKMHSMHSMEMPMQNMNSMQMDMMDAPSM